MSTNPNRISSARVVPIALAALWVIAVGLSALWYVDARHEADRFARYAEVADARILDSDLGCIGAIGGSGSIATGWSSAIVYRVAFPYRGGNHVTSVRRPCDVVPPDFGRGRGYIWVEYDRDDPDRIRVLTDDSAAERVRFGWELLVTAVAVGGVIAIWRRQRRHAGRRGERTGPAASERG